MFSFNILARDGKARLGKLATDHGAVDTPVFMPVGTAGSVKGVCPDQLRAAGVQMILANTYHLMLRPGPQTVEALGGLHRMMAWDGPILTDSGGYQVFSPGPPAEDRRPGRGLPVAHRRGAGGPDPAAGHRHPAQPRRAT